jgi:two-component system, NarL family, sensor kinase
MEQGVSNFALIFSIATVGMLVLAGAIILFVVFYQKKMIQEQLKRQQMELDYQQKMMEAALESQENERRRVAADLHDSIGAMLSTIRVGITTLAKRMNDPQSLDLPKQMLDDTITSVRRISRDLMPSTLDKFGFAQAVKEMCERFQATTNLPMAWHEHGEIKPMSKNRELMLFRIVQELINNAIKHSQATEINIHAWADEEIILSVEDNGVGFDPDAFKSPSQSGKGLGLYNIENRARVLGAKIEFERNRKQGSKTTLYVPYEKV